MSDASAEAAYQRTVVYSLRGRRVLVVASLATAFAAFGYAFAYIVATPQVDRSLLGQLGHPVVWSSIQCLLALAIVIAQWFGGHWLNATHTIAGVVQSMYLALWFATALLTGQGWFICPGVFMTVVVHWSLAGTLWTAVGRRVFP